MKKPTILISLLLVLAACVGGSSAGRVTKGVTVCDTPRPQVCTREYVPVCAIQNTGGLSTYGNACTACADDSVAGYVAGECGLPQMAACTEPRPQVCTADFLPVCGRLDGGGLKTFANACNACADASVVGFAEDACPVAE